MLREQLDGALDLARQRRRILDRESQHRLQHRLGQRHHGARAPAFRQQLLDELEAGHLVRRIDAVAEAVAQRRREVVATLPHVELFAAQAGDPDDLAYVQRVARITRGYGYFSQLHRRLASASGRCDQDAHRRRSLAFCVTCLASAVLHKFENERFQVALRSGPARRRRSCRRGASCGARAVPCTMRARRRARAIARPVAFGDHVSRRRGAGRRRSCTPRHVGRPPAVRRRETRSPRLVHHNPGNVDGSFLAAWQPDASVKQVPRLPNRDPLTDPMLRFRTTSSGPLGDVRSAERWLASLPANDPLVAQRSIVAELRKLAARTARRRPAMLEGGVQRRHPCERPRANPDGAVRRAREPLPQDRRPALAGAVRAGAGIPGVLRGVRPGDRRPVAAQQMARAPAGAHRAADRPSAPGREAPALSLRALGLRRSGANCSGRSRAPARTGSSASRFGSTRWARPTTIEREFLMTLLLQLADPGNLTPKEVEWIAAQLDAWCQPLRLTLTPTSATTFYVDLAGSTGLRRRSLAPLEGRVLFVDLQPLHALLLQNRAALEQAVRSEPRSGKTSQYREQLELFVKLASRIDPEFRPLARRGERKPARAPSTPSSASPPSARICARTRTPAIAAADAGRNFGNTMELAVFGRTRSGAGSRLEPGAGRARRVHGARRAWEMKDVSASGFRLHAPMSVAMELTLNMLVAIRRRDQDAWVLGIIRRMRRLSSRDAEIGLQLIANGLVSAELLRAAQGARGRLLGRTGRTRRHRPPVPRPVPVVQPARGRAAGAVPDRACRRVPPGPALHAADRGFGRARSGTGACSSSMRTGSGRSSIPLRPGPPRPCRRVRT